MFNFGYDFMITKRSHLVKKKKSKTLQTLPLAQSAPPSVRCRPYAVCKRGEVGLVGAEVGQLAAVVAPGTPPLRCDPAALWRSQNRPAKEVK